MERRIAFVSRERIVHVNIVLVNDFKPLVQSTASGVFAYFLREQFEKANSSNAVALLAERRRPRANATNSRLAMMKTTANE